MQDLFDPVRAHEINGRDKPVGLILHDPDFNWTENEVGRSLHNDLEGLAFRIKCEAQKPGIGDDSLISEKWRDHFSRHRFRNAVAKVRPNEVIEKGHKPR
jgi:hypothetical protein